MRPPSGPPLGGTGSSRTVLGRSAKPFGNPGRPIVVRDGATIRYLGLYYSNPADRGRPNLAAGASVPVARGWGIVSPVIWVYEWGSFSWDPTLLPPEELPKHQAAIAAMRPQLAADLKLLPTLDPLPVDYWGAYAAGEGRRWGIDPRGLLHNAGWTLAPLAAALSAYRSVRAVGALRTHDAAHRRGRCRSCGYDVAGLPSPRCPECGRVQ